MSVSTWYQRAKAAQRPSYFRRLARQRAYSRLHATARTRWYRQAKADQRPSYFRQLARGRAYQRLHATARANQRIFGDYQGALVGHCGQWWRPVRLPAQCPACEAVLLRQGAPQRTGRKTPPRGV